MRRPARFPTWRYRLTRLRYVDHFGEADGLELGVRVATREQFRHGDPEFVALAILVGPREFVFDLGKRRTAGHTPRTHRRTCAADADTRPEEEK